MPCGECRLNMGVFQRLSGDFEVVVWAVGSWGMSIFSWKWSYRDLLWVCEEEEMGENRKVSMYIYCVYVHSYNI